MRSDYNKKVNSIHSSVEKVRLVAKIPGTLYKKEGIFIPPTYYYIYTYSDGSRSVEYNNGYTEGHWCGVNKLKSHLHHLRSLKGRYDDTKNLIPKDWIVIDRDFFNSIGVYE